MRRLAGLWFASFVLMAACGSLGSNDPEATPTPDPNATRTFTRTRGPTRTPGGPTNTPTRTGQATATARPTKTPAPPTTLYVRQSGNDANLGTAPDQALRTLRAAIALLSPGSTIYVGRGVYTGRVAVTDVVGTAALPVQILADRTGDHTGDPDGEVILDANQDIVALILTRSPYVTIEGFTIRGVAPEEGAGAVSVRLRGASDHSVIRHCVIANAEPVDGIRVDSSNDVLVFDNLVFAADRGIVVTGAARGTQVINNTIARSARAGLSLRASGGIAPTDTRVANTIIQAAGTAVALDASGGPDGYDGDYNLVFQPAAEDQTTAYNPPDVRGEHDRNADALFVDLEAGDLHLAADSPAVDAGTADIDPALAEVLLERSTSEDGGRDRAPLDMGYHYPR